MKPRMSCFVTRPPMPDPWICDTSTLCSLAILRTRGDDLWRSPSAGADGARGAEGAGAGAGAALVVDGGAGAAMVAPGVPSACAECLAPEAPFAPEAPLGTSVGTC